MTQVIERFSNATPNTYVADPARQAEGRRVGDIVSGLRNLLRSEQGEWVDKLKEGLTKAEAFDRMVKTRDSVSEFRVGDLPASSSSSQGVSNEESVTLECAGVISLLNKGAQGIPEIHSERNEITRSVHELVEAIGSRNTERKRPSRLLPSREKYCVLI